MADPSPEVLAVCNPAMVCETSQQGHTIPPLGRTERARLVAEARALLGRV
jgi:hypothetical protein